MRIVGVIVNYRTAELALEAARALAAQLAPYDGSSLVLVDNDSRDGSEQAIRQGLEGAPWAARVRFVQAGHNGGFGAGNNVGIRLGLAERPPPDLFYFLNPDARPDPGAVDALVAFLAERPRAGIVGTGVHRGDGAPCEVAFRFPTLPSEVERGLRLGLATRLLERWRVPLPVPSAPTAVDWVTGSSMAIRREVFERVGLFDEGFFLYFEEIDLCHRAKDAGFEVFHVPSATVVHAQGTATGIHDRTRRMPAYWFASRWRYFRKHHGAAYAAGASVAWAASHAVFLAKERALGRAPDGAPRLLEDFARHTARAAMVSLRTPR